MYEKKKQMELERWEKKVREAEMGGQVWQVVNKQRKRKRKFNEGIGMKNGNKNTSGVYQEERRIMRGVGREMKEDKESKLGKEEIERLVRKLKNDRAMGGGQYPK